MDMRIVVPDDASAGSLVQRLTIVFGPERVSLEDERCAVNVHVTRESDRTVLRVLDAVEQWLDQAGVPSAETWLGDHSYRLARWAPIASTP